MNAAGRNIVITGAAGMIGRHVLARARGRHVFVAVERPGCSGSDALRDAALTVELDLESSWTVQGSGLPERCDAVIYLAQSDGSPSASGKTGVFVRGERGFAGQDAA